MRLSRFFVDMPLFLGKQSLPETVMHYMVKVLRLSVGTPVQLFNGTGQEFVGEILAISKKTLEVQLTQNVLAIAESPLYTHLGQGLSRGDRMDWVIQKATELGVNEITPLFTTRCEVKLSDSRLTKRLEHWQQIAISACEQCGRSYLPKINPPISLVEWCSGLKADLKLQFHPEATGLSRFTKPDSVVLLIGPEGGFTDEELHIANQQDFQSVRLGARVLRTETAPIVALSVAQQLWGDFN